MHFRFHSEWATLKFQRKSNHSLGSQRIARIAFAQKFDPQPPLFDDGL